MAKVVYRIEDENKRGPWSAPYPDCSPLKRPMYAYVDKAEQMYNQGEAVRNPSKMPLHSKSYWITLGPEFRVRFAFLDLLELSTWFKFPLRKYLRDVGYEVNVYSCPEGSLIYDSTQAVFLPEQVKLVKTLDIVTFERKDLNHD